MRIHLKNLSSLIPYIQQLKTIVRVPQGAHIIYQIDMLVMIIEKDQLKYTHRTKS